MGKTILENNLNYFKGKKIIIIVDYLSEVLIKENKSNVLLVKDVSTAQRKYLYNLLVEKGYPKSYLLRYSTTHLQ